MILKTIKITYNFCLISILTFCFFKNRAVSASTEPIIKVGEIGYCRFLKFKCAAARTCQAWVSGGPITSND